MRIAERIMKVFPIRKERIEIAFKMAIYISMEKELIVFDDGSTLKIIYDENDYVKSVERLES